MTEALEAYKATHGESPQGVLDVMEDIDALTITSPEDSDYLQAISSECKKRVKVIEKARKKITGPLNESVKETNAFFKQFREPWEEADRMAKGKVKAYLVEQDQARIKAQQEAIEAAQAAQAAAEEAALAESPEEEEEAAEALQEAREESREALMAAVAPTQGLGGGHRRSHWKAEVYDLKLLVLCVAEGLQAGDDSCLELLEPNMKLLNGEAKLQAAEGDICPGVKAWDDFSVVGPR